MKLLKMVKNQRSAKVVINLRGKERHVWDSEGTEHFLESGSESSERITGKRKRENERKCQRIESRKGKEEKMKEKEKEYDCIIVSPL